jgi:hypothetical protein
MPNNMPSAMEVIVLEVAMILPCNFQFIGSFKIKAYYAAAMMCFA